MFMLIRSPMFGTQRNRPHRRSSSGAGERTVWSMFRLIGTFDTEPQIPQGRKAVCSRIGSSRSSIERMESSTNIKLDS